MRHAWLLGLLLVLPTATAYHLSAGANDAVFLGASEPPASVDQDTYQTGTRTDCPDVDPSDPNVVFEDALCGQLVYNEEVRDLIRLSPQDQESLYDIKVDLVASGYLGTYGTTTCEPWCQAPQAYRAVHDAGEEAGLTAGGDQAWKGDGGTQLYGGNVYYPGTSTLYAQAGQSWLLPATDTSFVAFIHDRNNEPVGPERLAELVAKAQAGGLDGPQLDPEAVPQVCLYSPQADVGTHNADSGSFCEIPLTWMGTRDDREEFQDPCTSPSYLCGSLTPGWRSPNMCPMWHAACYFSDAWNSAHHFAVWHAVVAPSPDPACALAEPGFNVDPTGFLAHDLDIYEPPTHTPGLTGVPFIYEEHADNVPGLGPLREGRAPDISELPVVQAASEPLPFSEHTTEPNAGSWRGISESSQTLSTARSSTDCGALGTDEEAFDPWVNVVDAHVTQDVLGFGVPGGAEPEPDHEPLPRLEISGNVGIFADVDDDGTYEPAPANKKFSAVDAHGAYPILWDHHPEGEGCSFEDGTRIGDLASQAGYTSPTGLILVAHTSEAVAYDTVTGNSSLLLDTAAVFLSQGLDPQDPRVEHVIEKAADGRTTAIFRDAFGPQCTEPTGGFTSRWEIATQPSRGDGLITAALVTLDRPGPTGTATLQGSPIELEATTQVWWDVDPFHPSDG